MRKCAYKAVYSIDVVRLRKRFNSNHAHRISEKYVHSASGVILKDVYSPLPLFAKSDQDAQADEPICQSRVSHFLPGITPSRYQL